MKQSDRLQFLKLLTGLSEMFGKEFSDALLEMYFQALADLSIEQVQFAAERAIRECTWLPKPAELRAFVQGSSGDKAEAAWDLAVESYRKAGAFKSVLFEDGFVGQAIVTVFGGWVEFCNAMHPVYRDADDVSFEDREAARKERRVPESRQIQVGGLSEEMTANKRKQFIAAYKNAEREQKAKQYLPGQHESDNRNSVGSWNRGTFQVEGGREVYKLPVYVAEREQVVEATFDRLTGYLIGDVKALLQQEPVRAALPPVEPRRMLTDGSEMSEDELKEARAEFSAGLERLATRMKMPEPKRMTGEEIIARVRELKAQAEIVAAQEPEEVPA